MVISPLNVKAFYFKELPDEVKLSVINNKITFIIKNLDNKKYEKYKKNIDLMKGSEKSIHYREIIKKYNSVDLIKDILKENMLYDIHGNMFNIVFKNGQHILYLTKTTFIPIKIMNSSNYTLSVDNNKELPIITSNILNTPSYKIARQFAISKFANSNLDSSNSDSENIIDEAE